MKCLEVVFSTAMRLDTVRAEVRSTLLDDLGKMESIQSMSGKTARDR
jgi:hypothetical protein